MGNMKVPYKKKCERVGCNNFFDVGMEGKSALKIYCDKHSHLPKLQRNNPSGFNKHKKNPITPSKPLTEIEEFALKPDHEQKEIISKLGNDVFRIRREIRPLLLRFTKFKAYRDAKEYGWEMEE